MLRFRKAELPAVANLSKEEVVTLQVLRQKGESNCAIARRLGITEATVRYHLRQQAQPTPDRRAKTPLIVQMQLGEVVEHWWADQCQQLPGGRSPSVHLLYSHLVDQYAYTGSYKSVRKFVRDRYPAPVSRPLRRIETPPAAQVQSDWLEANVRLRAADGSVEVVKRYGFVMTLSHSRKTAIIWSERMDQLAWQHVHNEAFKRLEGIAAVNRIDNLKTGVAKGSGSTAQINTAYAGYARTMGFHIDPHHARQPQQKGKVERRVGAFKQLDLQRIFDGLPDLQNYTDETLRRDSVIRKCPVTGLSVHQTWRDEQPLLRPLPAGLPEPFDLIKQAAVHKDCTIRFEGCTYSVPYRFAGASVEVHGCSGSAQIVDPQSGAVLKQYPRQSEALLLIDQDCYEPQPMGIDDAMAMPAPLPLGQMAIRLAEVAATGVATRSIDFYAQIASAKSQSQTAGDQQ